MSDFEHCRHCEDPGDPRHQDPGYAKAEADCAWYEHPEHLTPAGPARKPKRMSRGAEITAAINADPDEVARLRLSRQQAREGKFE